MKKVFFALLVLATFGAPAFAGQDWLADFLRGYRPSTLPGQLNRTPAQDPLPGLIRNGQIPLSIPDLINLTLENNLDITVNRLSPLSRDYMTRTFYRPFQPTLRFAAGVTRNTSPSRSQFTGAPSLTELSHNYSFGFGQTFATGTSVDLDMTMSRASSNNVFNTFNPAWVGLVQYSVRQNLLRDFGRNANTYQIRIAQNNKTISEVQFELQVIDLVTQAQKVYWDLVFTAEDLKVKQRSLDLAQKTLSDNRIQVDIGTLAAIDLIQAESQVAVRREELLVSDFTQTQIADQIKKIVSPRPDPGLVLAKVAPTQAPALPRAADVLPIDAAVRTALENRPELRQVNLEIRNRDIELEHALNQLKPSLEVSATYVQNGVGGRETIRNGFGPTAPIVQVNQGNALDALSQLFGYKFTGYSAGFNLQIPLGNRAGKAEYGRLATEKQVTENRIKAIEQQIVLEVRNAINQIEMNKARIEAAQTSRALAEKQLEAEQKKFGLGASTLRYVLEEQRNLTQMQTNEIATLVNYSKALVDYDRALGLTLNKYSIEIQKTLSASK